MQMEQVYRQKMTVKVMKLRRVLNIFFIDIFVLAWLSNIITIKVEFFKFIYLCLQSSDWLNKLIMWSVYLN
jgi:hypothetical protein